ncbi:Coenzyme F420 hydrogenase/dehydrogenase, beta subunit C-terminal domain [Nocardioides sp. MAHUQ-72]|uniref:Coenzyme F420 hydrogenase/dehydrogenase, beta subunit C-terminal domain n=1 Tax=unclassified Nocardioides TaxID=2615069 RepID=UPI00360CDEF9
MLAEERFGTPERAHPVTGGYRRIFAGRVADSVQVMDSSSGGTTSWLARQMLRDGSVDGVIQVGPSSDGRLFAYSVARTPGEVNVGRKSKYYPVSFADAFTGVRGDGRRYAFIGVPCQVRAARAVCDEDEVLGEQIVRFIGLVCGHLKSSAYAESLSWQLDIEPHELSSVDFRVKVPGRGAKSYNFEAVATDGRRSSSPMGPLVGGSWGHAAFQLGACDFCDDIFAETADVTLGDAWLPEYEADSRGTNIILTRSAEADATVEAGIAAGELEVEDLSPQRAAVSQAGNQRHRREGLAVRLADDLSRGLWVPTKRVEAGYEGVSAERIAVIRSRRKLGAMSHVLFQDAKDSGNLDAYLRPMRALISKHTKLARREKAAAIYGSGRRGQVRWLLARALARVARSSDS